ncbi:MAG TPA: ATP-binding cassette domain-containing protein [Isosphaeraceae bacterium]|nr:ATP-binding cassette domain-containing protein [Isosphaeraceae bacterium]
MAFPAAALIAALALPIIGIPVFVARLIETAAVFTMLVSSFNLTFGYAGELTFNQLFLFAAGGVTAGYLEVSAKQTDFLIALPVVALVAVVIGLPLGLPGLRFGYLSSAMVSLFLIALFPTALQAAKPFTGGLFGIALPTLAGIQLDNTSFYLMVIVVAGGWLIVMRNLTVSHWGERLQVLRTSPILAQTLGLSPIRLKLAVYALSCVPAAIAGALFAYMNTVVLPIDITGALLLLGGSVIGGAVTVYGAIVGAVAVEIVPYLYLSLAGTFDVLLGLGLILTTLILPGGAAQVGRLIRERWLPASYPIRRPDISTDRQARGADIVMSGVRRRFGGVSALDGVDFDARPGRVTAIVGPNGSGKTTLLNAITGAVTVEAGSIKVAGREVSGKPPDWIARRGIRRTFQTPLVPATSILSAVIAGRLDRPHPGFLATVARLPGFRRSRSQDQVAAAAALHRVGIKVRASLPVSELPVATRRLVEVARAIAAEPSVVLLDEPAAGLDDSELATLGGVLKGLCDMGITVVVVEHNLSFVLSIADTLYVMQEGRAIANGDPAAVLRNPEAQAAFLGGIEGFAGQQPIETVASFESRGC